MVLANVPDVNAMLAGEQSAVMRANRRESSGNERATQRESARHYRHLLNQTGFPSREPHRFDGEPAAAVVLEGLAAAILTGEQKLDDDFAAGRVGMKNNTLQHRQRVLRQARAALSDLRAAEGSREIMCPDTPLTSAGRDQELMRSAEFGAAGESSADARKVAPVGVVQARDSGQDPLACWENEGGGNREGQIA
jgi:hypothetical protein